MLKKFLEIKNIIIVALTLLVVWLIVFRPSKSDIMAGAEYKINHLEEKNYDLLERNDKLIEQVKVLNYEIVEILSLTSQNENELGDIDNKLNELLKRKDEVRSNIDTLDNVGVANAFTGLYPKEKSNRSLMR